jgi:hypothetical protein
MQEDQKSMLKYYQHLSPIENSLIMFRLFVRCSILYSSQRPAITGATERIPDSTPYPGTDRVRRNGTTFILKKKKEVCSHSSTKWLYNDSKVIYSGPKYESMQIEKNKIILSFSLWKCNAKRRTLTLLLMTRKFIGPRKTVKLPESEVPNQLLFVADNRR